MVEGVLNMHEVLDSLPSTSIKLKKEKMILIASLCPHARQKSHGLQLPIYSEAPTHICHSKNQETVRTLDSHEVR